MADWQFERMTIASVSMYMCHREDKYPTRVVAAPKTPIVGYSAAAASFFALRSSASRCFW